MKLEQLADVFVDTLKKTLAGPNVQGRFEALEARLAAVESGAYLKFCGTFQGGTSYNPGDAVIHQSALWICKVATQGTPSKDFVGWQLALKKGDAR